MLTAISNSTPNVLFLKKLGYATTTITTGGEITGVRKHTDCDKGHDERKIHVHLLC